MDSFKSKLERFNSAEKVSSYMQSHLQYATEEQRKASRQHGCWWKTPEETNIDGFGFCYDLAAFALVSLIGVGIENAELLFVAWGRWGIDANSGHIVCIYSDGDSYYCIDNGALKGPFLFNQLLKSASRDREIHTLKTFGVDKIPYHTRYCEMTGFVGS